MNKWGVGFEALGLGNPLQSASGPTAPPPPEDHSARRRKILKWIAIVVGGFVLLLAALLVAFREALTHAPEYRAQVQAWVSQRTGLDIQFTRMDARWRYYGPELVFDSAVVRSRDGKRKLVSARSVSLGFDLWTAISTFRLAAGRVTLEAPELQIIRTPEGRFEVVGQSDLPERNPDLPFKPDDMPTGRLQVVDAQVTYRDLKTGRAPWVVPGVSFDLERRGGSMHLQGAAQLPTKLGKTLRFVADTEGRLAATRELQWKFSVDARELDLEGLAELSPKDWPAPRSGRGSFTLGGVFEGATLYELSAKVEFNDIVLTLPAWHTPLPPPAKLDAYVENDANEGNEQTETPTVPAIANVQPPNEVQPITIEPALAAYQRIGFDLQLTHSISDKGDTWRTHVKDLELSRLASPWLRSDLSVTVTRTNDGGVGVAAQSNLLVLENLWPLLAYAPESVALAHARALNASGHVSEVQADFGRASADAPVAYSIHARLSGLSMQAIGKAPGIGNISGLIEGSDSGGRMELNVRNGSLDLPRFFRTPLPVDRIAGTILWRHESAGWRIETNEVLIDGADGHARAGGDVFVPSDGSSVETNVHAQGWDLVARAAPRYLPASKLSPKTLEWLDRAFVAGSVPTAEFEMHGPVRAFPFRNGEGLFLIKAHIAGLTLDYQPGWIPATRLSVDAEFRNEGMSATLLQGELNGLSLVEGTGRFVDFKQAELQLDAKVKGNLDSALTYVQRSPVGPAIGAQFMLLHGTGAMQGQVELRLPFKDIEDRKLVVNTHIDAGVIGTKDIAQTVTELNGTLNVRDNALSALDLNGTFLGGPVAIKGGVEGRYTGHGAGLLITAQGRAQGIELGQLLHLPASIPLGGTMQYQFSAHAPRHPPGEPAQPTYRVESDTKGLSLGLPAPLGKSADVARALQLDLDATHDDALLVRCAFGAARALVRLQKDDTTWSLDRGGIRVDGIAAAVPPHTGLRIEGAIDNFELDDWLQLKGDQPGQHQLSEYLRAANVRLGRFGYLGFSWPAVHAIMQATDNAWRIDVDSDDVAGQLSIPYKLDGRVPLQIALTKLNVGAHETRATNANNKAANTQDPRDIPAISGRVDDLSLSGRHVGLARFVLDKVDQGVKLTTGELRGDSFTATAHGSWLVNGTGDSASSLVIDLASTDVRNTLRAFNFHDFIVAKQANAHASLVWSGGIDEDLLGRASGNVKIEVVDGQLLKVDIGDAGRLLSLLSLDFKDVTDKGVNFDKIHADFELKNGDAFTNNLFLHGPQAELGVVGRTGLGKHDYDLTAVGTADLGSSLGTVGTAVGTLAGGPVLGAAVLAFSRLFKEPLRGATRHYYRITGAWDDPTIERIDKEGAKQGSDAANAAVSESQKTNAEDAARSAESETTPPATPAVEPPKPPAHAPNE